MDTRDLVTELYRRLGDDNMRAELFQYSVFYDLVERFLRDAVGGDTMSIGNAWANAEISSRLREAREYWAKIATSPRG